MHRVTPTHELIRQANVAHLSSDERSTDQDKSQGRWQFGTRGFVPVGRRSGNDAHVGPVQKSFWHYEAVLCVRFANERIKAAESAPGRPSHLGKFFVQSLFAMNPDISSSPLPPFHHRSVRTLVREMQRLLKVPTRQTIRRSENRDLPQSRKSLPFSAVHPLVQPVLQVARPKMLYQGCGDCGLGKSPALLQGKQHRKQGNREVLHTPESSKPAHFCRRRIRPLTMQRLPGGPASMR